MRPLRAPLIRTALSACMALALMLSLTATANADETESAHDSVSAHSAGQGDEELSPAGSAESDEHDSAAETDPDGSSADFSETPQSAKRSATGAALTSLADIGDTGSWQATGGKWKWRGDDGVVLRSQWARIHGDYYYFGADEFMRTGWFAEDGQWFHCAPSGDASLGWLLDGGAWYYLDPATGVMHTGLLTQGATTYFLADSGAMATGWVHSSQGWRFFTGSGAMATGWLSRSGAWYYLDPATGVMHTGLLTQGATTYFLADSGAMATGWVHHFDGWRLYTSSGAELFAWQKVGTAWYYFDTKSGIMATVDQTIGGTRYRFQANGEWINYQAPAGYLQPTSSITPLGSATNQLTWGMNGVKVRIVQQRLGIWNSGTLASVDATFQRAVRNFQTRAGLPATGNVDQRTWNALGTGYSWYVDQYQATPISVSASREEHIDAMIGYAWNQMGSSYTWGGAGPYDLGFDCSGLVLQAMYAGGIDPQPITVVKHGLPSYRTSRELYNHSALMYKPLSERRRGDLIFYTTDGVITHVALYIGNDQVIHTDWMGRPARVQHITVGYGWANTAPWVARPFP